MSNSIIYDPLLVRYLARELDDRVRGRACAAALVFAGDRRAVLPLDRGEALDLDLHPSRGWIRIVPWAGEEELEAECGGVSAPPDERRLCIPLRLDDRFRPERRELVVELQTNQWNALLLAEDARVLALAWTRSHGARRLRSGAPYEPPPGLARYGAGAVPEEEAWARWRETLAGLEPAARPGALLAAFAYTGTPNAAFVLGEAGAATTEPALRAAFERWWWLRSLPPEAPVLLPVGRRVIPYPLPLADGGLERVGSLLEGMERVAAAPAHDGTRAEAPELAGRVRARRGLVARRIERLEEELAGSDEPEKLRASADLLLAKLHEVPKGASVALLEGWEGDEVSIALDPALSAAENASRLYDEARRRVRGALRVARLLEEARGELARWEAALEATEAGSPPGWAELELTRTESAGGGTTGEPSQPYRVYRTSGGLEARVGKSAKGNDELTFRHSAPDDVWLHAQSVPGSHVILRWPDPTGSPPARDLAEAATLAASFSRARSSGLVAVDWTRRKHVRKPRGAPPGSVVPQRVRTLFVEPDEKLAERLREE